MRAGDSPQFLEKRVDSALKPSSSVWKGEQREILIGS